jgi:hypothetical protein
MAPEETARALSTLDSMEANSLKPGSFDGLTTGLGPVFFCATKICNRDCGG